MKKTINIPKITEWYRRKTWTISDKEEFFAKLKRARDYNRPQYLRIQAIELIETKEDYHLEVAERLLKILLKDYPENRTEKSPALSALGEIYKLQGDFEKALVHLKEALDIEKAFPGVITSAALNFSEMVIQLGKTEFYNEVENLLTEKIQKDSITFPSEYYIIYSALSIIADYKNDIINARTFAQLAEKYATVKSNSLWNPQKQKIGIVSERKSWLHNLLKR